MTASVQHALVTIAILALIAWRMHARVRRMIGRQRLSRVRPWISIVVFPLLVAMLAFAALRQHSLAMYLASGVIVGVGLGVLGLRLTRFETTTEGLYYTPSAHLGVALSALLLCRIAYRFAVGGLPDSGAASAPPGANLTPLTLLLIGTLAGYYTTYALGLVRWSWRSRGLAPSAASDSGAV
ncbi:MAG TPA: CcdC protein domain-containing protein [Steroidobacteraceae bacterium]|nr:CcdC protein domain-containing protein [Steroidobacteraceae bacterium]